MKQVDGGIPLGGVKHKFLLPWSLNMNSRAAIFLQVLAQQCCVKRRVYVFLPTFTLLVCCERLSGRTHARTAEDQERTDGWGVQSQVISGREETAKDSRRQNAHGFLATQILPISDGRGEQIFDRYKTELAKINQRLMNARARRKEKLDLQCII